MYKYNLKVARFDVLNKILRNVTCKKFKEVLEIQQVLFPSIHKKKI